MAINVTLKAAGLQTFANTLSLDDGALLKADNIVIDRPGIIEQRRGFSEYGDEFPTVTDYAKQLIVYKGRVFRHYDDVLQFDSDSSGTFHNFSGNYLELETGIRLKSLESNGNLYFTTAEGVQKISATAADQFTTAANFVTRSGVAPALDLALDISASSEGFLPIESKAAYRVVWGTRDANNNLILGAPSQRQVVSNPAIETLIPSFNRLLAELDAAAATTILLSSSSYFPNLNLDSTALASDVLAGLTSLASDLDSDFKINELNALVQVEIPSSTVARLAFTSAISSYLEIGDKLQITGMSAVTQLNNPSVTSYWTVTEVNGVTATLSVTGLSTAGTTAATGNINSYNYRAISAPTALSTNPTFNELTSIKTYFESIVDQLNVEPATWTDQTAFSLPTDLAEVKLTFTIPEDITAANASSFFYQVYRTEVRESSGTLTLSEIDPGDEMALVLEDNPTTAQIAAKKIVALDGSDDSFRGVNLYTNSNSGEGILQANYRAPIARDVALFKDCVFYANTKSNHKKALTLLGYTQLNTSVTAISATSVAVSSNIATISFNGAVSSYISNNDVVTLLGFASSGVVLNGAHAVSAAASSISFPVTTSNFTDSATANFGTVGKSEYLTLTRGLTTERYTFVPALTEKTEIVFGAGSTLAATGAPSYFLLNSPDTNYYVWYNIGSVTTPAVTGYTLLEVVAASGDTAAVIAEKTIYSIKKVTDFNSTGTDFLSSTGYVQNITEGYVTATTDGNTAFTFRRNMKGSGELPASGYVAYYTSGTPAQNIADIAQSLVTTANRKISGELYGYYLSGVNDPPGKMQFESRDLDSTAFVFNSSKLEVGESFDPTIPVTGNTVISDNEVNPNFIYFSKQRQPEAVPIVNYFPIGPKDKKIIRILALRDSLFIMKEDGIYRISGDNPNNFSSFLFDTSAKILASDSAAILNNQIYMWSDQGVVTVSDTGVNIISRPIENQLNRLVNLPAYQTASFGIGYDLDRAYLFWTVDKSGDTKATQCFRYNIFTQAWTRWPISKTCGVVNPMDNRLYLGSGLRPYIEKERKSLDRTDFSDRNFEITIADSSVNADRIILNTVADVKKHDVLLQTQYVTLANFNLLLKKLDLDPATLLTNTYYSSLAASAGANLKNGLEQLATKLDTDLSSTAFSAAVTGIDNMAPSTLQTAYNLLTDALNASTAITFINYPSVSGTTTYEAILNNVSISEVAATSHIPLPLIVGPADIYKHYDSEVEYAPQHFGNPVALKHVRESTYLFQADNFHGAEFSYASDLSPAFDSIEINNAENGTFGNNTFGEGYFGGGGQSVPLRVLVPGQKQRCTFIRCRFKHSNARELYQLFGVSLTTEMNQVEARAYR